jgi:CBS domain-containing protein
MPVFFVHDVNHGIVTPLDRKFRVREIGPAEEVNSTRAIHPKQETDPENFKHHYDKQRHPGQHMRTEEQNEQPAGQQQRAIQAYQEQTTTPKLSLGRVKEIMSHPLISTFQDQNLQSAWHLMQQHEIDHLIIFNEAYHYCGLLSARKLAPYLIQLIQQPGQVKTAEQIPLTHFCQENLLSTHPETEVTALGPAMLEYGLDAVAVSDNGRIIGIVTKSDVFKVIIRQQRLEVEA